MEVSFTVTNFAWYADGEEFPRGPHTVTDPKLVRLVLAADAAHTGIEIDALDSDAVALSHKATETQQASEAKLAAAVEDGSWRESNLIVAANLRVQLGRMYEAGLIPDPPAGYEPSDAIVIGTGDVLSAREVAELTKAGYVLGEDVVA